MKQLQIPQRPAKDIISIRELLRRKHEQQTDASEDDRFDLDEVDENDADSVDDGGA